MQLRLGNIKDLAPIMQIVKNATNRLCELGIDQWDDYYPSEQLLAEDIHANSLYIAENKNKIISFFVLNENGDLDYSAAAWKHPNNYCIAHRLCVDPQLQGGGFGKATVVLMEKTAKKLGYQSVRLDAYIKNYISLCMYDSLGYTRVGQSRYEDALFICFEKLL